MVQIKAKIIFHKRLSGNYWFLEFESGLIAKNASPGQFVNIKVSDTFEPLLRRPISIHGVEASKVKLVYEALGQGTRALSCRKPGEVLDIIGPLGKGFSYKQPTKAGPIKNILIAGGMGIAPLFFLAQKIKITKPLILIGAKNKNQLLGEAAFKKLGAQVQVATDNGSKGFEGKVTDLLERILEENRKTEKLKNLIYACGPRPMLKVIAQIALKNKINAQLSLEEHLACGIGACLGCVVATKSGYRRVCKDGPVFYSDELTW